MTEEEEGKNVGKGIVGEMGYWGRMAESIYRWLSKFGILCKNISMGKYICCLLLSYI